MTVLETILGILLKIGAAVVLAFAIHASPITLPTSRTLPVWKLPSVSTSSFPTLSPIATSATTSTKVAVSSTTTPPKTPSPVVPVKKPVAIPLPQIPTATTPSPEPSATSSKDFNAKTREALVNVLCITSTGGYLRPISGTGVIIDERGVVLTNAHIGQFFLLRDYPFTNNVQCILRTGSPASPVYTAELLYFPRPWLEKNAKKIVDQNPTGTGEHDFSLLLITGRTNPAASLPATFPHLDPYVGSDFHVGENMLLAGYPAGFLEGATITTGLYTSSAIGAIADIFTFAEGGGSDLISIPGTILSQKGSSGGAAVRTDTGALAGLIVTATTADTTAARDLRAITLRHINLDMIDQTGKSLSSYLSGDLREKADTFNVAVAPTLSKMLTTVLDAN